MIGVIADDLTGAVECAGVAHRYGFSVQVLIGAQPLREMVDVVVYDTNSRDCPESETRQRVHDVMACLPTDIELFKKIDSACRGFIEVELDVLSDFRSRPIVICPASPKTGRTVVEGHLMVDGCPIEETDFGSDPTHPVNDGHIQKRYQLIGTVANAETHDDLLEVVGSKKALFAGSSALLAAWFERVHGRSIEHGFVPLRSCAENPVLIASGSKHVVSHAQLKHIQKRNNRPDVLSLSPETHGDPLMLAKEFAEKVWEKLSQERVQSLIISGGATASEIMQRLTIKHLQVRHEIAHGCVVLSSDKVPVLVMKPGSYGCVDFYKELCYA